MQRSRSKPLLVLTPWLALILTGCGADKEPPKNDPADTSGAPTYWQDVAPLFAQHCNGCHQSGGIAPFRLDDYASARAKATQIREATATRSMPPWGATSDDSCRELSGSLALSDAEIGRIKHWVDNGAVEGKKETISQPETPHLASGKLYRTPEIVPEPQGGELAEHDEYRCFMLDSDVSTPSFITSYEVTPGTPEIVHHAILMLVDPAAPAETGQSNLERMQALDAESPDRDGWPCFSGAGDGVNANSSPVVWAPGQGVVEYPANSGVPIGPKDKVVIQVHYNLAEHHDLSDQTSVALGIADTVENVALFALVDPFLDSIDAAQPDSLPPGLPSTKYSWQQSFTELGLDQLPEVTLRGVMPHMHQLGHRYRMTVTQGGEQQCGVEVPQWDFHWQRMYFYQQPIPIGPTGSFGVTCDFDTSSRSTPVLPGWGTQNEMCLATLFFTVPLAALQGP